MPVLISFLALTTLGQIKTSQPLPTKKPFAESLQAVVVITEAPESPQGKARLFERKSVKTGWKKVSDEFPVVVGRNGLGWSADSAPEGISDFKKEGDGRSPAGLMLLTFAFGRPDRPNGVKLSYVKLEEYSECVDDMSSSHYNRLVDRLKVGMFDWKTSEKMLEVGQEYDLGIFVAHNSYPVRPGNGSCIFLHIWKDPMTGTSGCTAMARENLQRILAWADPAKHTFLVQLTKADRDKYRKAWNLPK